MNGSRTMRLRMRLIRVSNHTRDRAWRLGTQDAVASVPVAHLDTVPAGPLVAEPPELSRLKCAGHHHKGNTDSNALQTE